MVSHTKEYIDFVAGVLVLLNSCVMLAALALSVIRVRQAHYNLDSRTRDSVFIWSWALVESNQQDVEAELEAEGLAYGAQLGFGRGPQ